MCNAVTLNFGTILRGTSGLRAVVGVYGVPTVYRKLANVFESINCNRFQLRIAVANGSDAFDCV